MRRPRVSRVRGATLQLETAEGCGKVVTLQARGSGTLRALEPDARLEAARDNPLAVEKKMNKLVTAILLAFSVLMVSGPRTTLAAPNSTTGSTCNSQGKPFSSIEDKDECKACGGAWTVSSTGCGGGIISGSLATIGGLLTANPWAVAGGIVLLGKAKSECDGKCEAKA